MTNLVRVTLYNLYRDRLHVSDMIIHIYILRVYCYFVSLKTLLRAFILEELYTSLFFVEISPPGLPLLGFRNVISKIICFIYRA